MQNDNKRRRLEKKGAATVTVLATAALACGLFAVSCAPKANVEKTTVSTESSANAGTTSRDAYAEMFPNQVATLDSTRVNTKGITIGHSKGILRDICEGPLARDNNGSIATNDDGYYEALSYRYNEETKTYEFAELTDDQLKELGLYQGCLSCKTSKFTDLYTQNGASAYGSVYNADAKQIVADDYFDCAMCHDGTPSKDSVQANQTYWNQLGEGLKEKLPTSISVCGQCHNSFDYRSKIKTEDDLTTFRPYKNGYDIDGLFETCWEDGTNMAEDEESGLMESYLVHPTVEAYMGTTHQEMGLGCTDCHMPTSTSDSGEQFTNHFSANSPLESEDSLNKCLECHTAQGISSTDEMKDWVRGKEADLAASIETLENRAADVKAALVEARDSGKISGEQLEAAKKAYCKMTFIDKMLVTGGNESVGSQVAMLDSASLLEKANACGDEVMSLIA